MLHYSILFRIAICCAVKWCSLFDYSVQYLIAIYLTALYYTILYYVSLYFTALCIEHVFSNINEPLLREILNCSIIQHRISFTLYCSLKYLIPIARHVLFRSVQFCSVKFCYVLFCSVLLLITSIVNSHSVSSILTTILLHLLSTSQPAVPSGDFSVMCRFGGHHALTRDKTTLIFKYQNNTGTG